MADKIIKKNVEDVDLLVSNWLSSHKELNFDYEEQAEFVYADIALLDRDEIQDALDNCLDEFSARHLQQVNRADQDLLDNIETAAEWTRNLVGDPDQPHAHWWWYLDWIADEMMDAPDLDMIFSSYIEKAERKNARAF